MEPIRLKLVPGGREGELLAAGWSRQTTIGEPRLSEIVANYRSMGYEVHVVEHAAQAAGDGGDDCGSCSSCFSAGAESGQFCGDVYIRSSGKATPLEDDLF